MPPGPTTNSRGDISMPRLRHSILLSATAVALFCTPVLLSQSGVSYLSDIEAIAGNGNGNGNSGGNGNGGGNSGGNGNGGGNGGGNGNGGNSDNTASAGASGSESGSNGVGRGKKKTLLDDATVDAAAL